MNFDSTVAALSVCNQNGSEFIIIKELKHTLKCGDNQLFLPDLIIKENKTSEFLSTIAGSELSNIEIHYNLGKTTKNFSPKDKI